MINLDLGIFYHIIQTITVTDYFYSVISNGTFDYDHNKRLITQAVMTLICFLCAYVGQQWFGYFGNMMPSSERWLKERFAVNLKPSCHIPFMHVFIVPKPSANYSFYIACRTLAQANELDSKVQSIAEEKCF